MPSLQMHGGYLICVLCCTVVLRILSRYSVLMNVVTK